MPRLLVTGATGLAGSVFCELALSRGYAVRALVRSTDADTATGLADRGVQLAVGDVTDRDSVIAAAPSVDGIVHFAAVIGGTWASSTPEEFWAVNYRGVKAVLDAATEANVPKTVLVNTLTISDTSSTVTERSAVAPIADGDSVYLQTKRAAYYEAMRRACLGIDVSVVQPGAIFGPSPFLERATVPTSFNALLLLGLRGEIERYADMPMCWAHVADVAAVALAAVEHGARGARYLAAGRPQDVCSTAAFCNLANEIAGAAHRVADQPLSEVAGEIGAMKHLAERTYAEPYFDAGATADELGVLPRLLREGIADTVRWLQSTGAV